MDNVKGRRLVLQFDVERVKIHDYGPGDARCRDPLCARNLDVSHFLNLHSKTEHDDFCLAYVFTHREGKNDISRRVSLLETVPC